MLKRICVSLMLAAAVAAFGQDDIQADSTPSSSAGTAMAVPLPLTGIAYPVEVGAESGSDYFRAGLIYETAYINNLYPGSGSPLHEMTYSIAPTVSFDQSTARQHRMFTLSAGQRFYKPTSTLNETDENATVTYQIRLTPHSSLNSYDLFQSNSMAFGWAGSTTGGGVSGSPEVSTPGITPPFARRMTNTANAGYTLQTGPNSMVGASGVSRVLHYPNSSDVQDVYDSSSWGGSAFYNRRLSEIQYFGAVYQHLDMTAYPVRGQSNVYTDIYLVFYTIYPRQAFSLSILCGPQKYEAAQSSEHRFSSWEPSVSASLGWQGIHTSSALSYSQSVTGGGGLLGAYRSRSTNAAFRWKMARQWEAGANGSYSNIRTVTPMLSLGTPGGSTLSATVTLERSIGPRLSWGWEYDFLRQHYDGIAEFSKYPDSTRAVVTLTWHFMRPLGR